MQTNRYINNNVSLLPKEAIAFISLLFSGVIKDFENAYMVEIKIDDPLKHIVEDDDCFIIYDDLDQYINKAKHLFDDQWAVIHKKDLNNISDYDKVNLKRIAKEYIDKITKITTNEV